MKKKYKEFIALLGILFLFLFRNSFNEIITILNKDFDFTNVNTFTCNDAIKENEELKKMMEFAYDTTYSYEISRVKYRDVLEFSDSFQIFKGSNDGLSKGLAVINDKGLVGILSFVDKATSKVELITNKNSQVSVKMGDAFGILKYRDHQLVVSDIASDGNVHVGDKIYTSGLANLPGNILVGVVKEVVLDSLEIEQTVIVDAAVNFNQVSYLMVVKSE